MNSTKASFHADQTQFQIGKQLRHPTTAQLFAHYSFAMRIKPMMLYP
jgi:hypothetical protein